MIQKIKSFTQRNYFDRSFPLDYRTYMIFFFESLFISILSATTNTVLGKGVWGLVLQWGYIALCLVLLFVKPALRIKLQKPQLLFISFVYIPFLYFQTAGFDGTALLFAQLGLFLVAIVFTGKLRVILIALNILDYVACVWVQLSFPGLVIPHADIQSKVIDLIVAMTLSFSGLTIMAAYISDAFAKKNAELADLSNRDALTGVYNRRFLSDYLLLEMRAAEETNTPLHLIMMDLDHFKSINDQYGHGFGDDVLKAFTQCVQGVMRDHDVLARYGGEEFVVVLSGLSLQQATEIAERIRLAFEARRFRNGAKATVSLGLAWSKPGETAEALLDRADGCLYEAKRTGRNRVVVQS